MSKVSIVIPIYNVEPYLNKCIESIVNQTYKDLEIILVDDGSTDNSPSICDAWEEKDKRVTVIHKENGGLSSARNTGLKVATGNYIMFEDSDDWVELNIVEKCVERIEKDQSDLVIFGYKKVDENGKDLGNYTFGNETYTKEEMSNQLHKRILEMSFGYAWNKLYRLSVIKESGTINDSSIIDREDLYFNLQLFNHLRRISYLDCVGYFYLQRKTSLLHNSNLARLNGVSRFCNKMKQIKWGCIEDEKRVFNMNVLHYLSDCIIKNILWNKELSKKEKYTHIRQTVEKIDYKNELFYDRDNPKYLNILFDGIKNNDYKKYYRYVRLSSIKSKITG